MLVFQRKNCLRATSRCSKGFTSTATSRPLKSHAPEPRNRQSTLVDDPPDHCHTGPGTLAVNLHRADIHSARRSVSVAFQWPMVRTTRPCGSTTYIGCCISPAPHVNFDAASAGGAACHDRRTSVRSRFMPPPQNRSALSN